MSQKQRRVQNGIHLEPGRVRLGCEVPFLNSYPPTLLSFSVTPIPQLSSCGSWKILEITPVQSGKRYLKEWRMRGKTQFLNRTVIPESPDYSAGIGPAAAQCAPALPAEALEE